MIGIYRLINIINGKSYIGSSVDINKRVKRHVRELRDNKHANKHLQRSWIKYGGDSFIYTIIELTDINNLRIREQYYLDSQSCEYNICIDATAPMMGRTHTRETILKMKNRIQPTGKDSPSYGKKWSKETREKILKTRVGLKRTTQFKEKQRSNAIKKELHKYLIESNNKRKLKIIDSNGIIHNSLVECADYHKISTQTVCDILKGRHFKTRKGVSFKYA